MSIIFPGETQEQANSLFIPPQQQIVRDVGSISGQLDTIAKTRTVQTDAGVDVIDGTGLVSVNNFDNAEVSMNTTRTTSSNSFSDVTGGALSEVTFDRTRRVLIFLFAYGRSEEFNNDSESLEVQVYDTFTAASTGINVFINGEWFTEVVWDTGTGQVTATTERAAAETQSNWGIIDADAGAHTFKLRFRATENNRDCSLFNARLGYIVLGD